MSFTHIESVEKTDVGRRRQNNEDSCLRIHDKGVYCVADGMGGVAGGDLASQTITAHLLSVFDKASSEDVETRSGSIALVRKAVNEASKWIKNFADEKAIGQMGSTVVTLVLDPRDSRRATGLHAGDSRLYRFRDRRLEQLTTDHSVVAVLAAKLGRPADTLPAKYQNELTRAVGLEETSDLETTKVEVRKGDLFILCSDGLPRMVPDGAIEQILKAGADGSLDSLAERLINQANEAGGKDNVTVVLVRVKELAVVPQTPCDEDEEGPAAVDDDWEQIAEPNEKSSPERRSDSTDNLEGRTPDTARGSGISFNRLIVMMLAFLVIAAAGFWIVSSRLSPTGLPNTTDGGKSGVSQKDLDRANLGYEKLLVWFGVKKPDDPYFETPEARSQQLFVGALGEKQRKYYLGQVDQIEKDFQAQGLLNQRGRGDNLKLLRKAIQEHE